MNLEQIIAVAPRERLLELAKRVAEAMVGKANDEDLRHAVFEGLDQGLINRSVIHAVLIGEESCEQ